MLLDPELFFYPYYIDSLKSSDDDDENEATEVLDIADPPVDSVPPSEERDDEEGISPEEFRKDMYVIVEYEGELFPGKITKLVENGVKVSCMKKCLSAGSTWIWPKQIDEEDYPYCDIRFKNVTLNELPGTARKVEYDIAELDHIWGGSEYM